MNSRGDYIITNVLLKVIMRFALSATLYTHETMSLMGMYEPKKAKTQKKRIKIVFILISFCYLLK